MDILFLTGAAGEPAQTIARRLVNVGFRIYGFAHRFPENSFAHPDFHKVPVNIADPAAVISATKQILARENTLTAIIHAACFDSPEPFDALDPAQIAGAVNAALTAPLLLTRAALPTLIRRRGQITVITKTPEPSRDAAVPAPSPENVLATSLNATLNAALATFAETLFNDLRNTGVKSAHIHLANNTDCPPDPQSRLTRAPQSRVQPEVVADTIEFLLRLRESNALTSITLRPQSTRETPRLPVSDPPRTRSDDPPQLPPPEKFPPPEEPIETPPRQRPEYAPPPGSPRDEPDSDEDNTVDPELLYLVRSPQNFAPSAPAAAAKPPATQPPAAAAQPPAATSQPPAQPLPAAHSPTAASALRREPPPRRKQFPKKSDTKVAIIMHPPQITDDPPAPIPTPTLRPAPQNTTAGTATGSTNGSETAGSEPAATAGSTTGTAAAPRSSHQSPAHRSPRPPADETTIINCYATPVPGIPVPQYPENWHGPRPPNRFQRKEAEKRMRYDKWRIAQGLPARSNKGREQNIAGREQNTAGTISAPAAGTALTAAAPVAGTAPTAAEAAETGAAPTAAAPAAGTALVAEAAEIAAETPPAPPKRRGRPPKSTTAAAGTAENTAENTAGSTTDTKNSAPALRRPRRASPRSS